MGQRTTEYDPAKARRKPHANRRTGPAAITAALMNTSPRRPGTDDPPTPPRFRLNEYAVRLDEAGNVT